MPKGINSTLVEVQLKLSEILYTVLSTLEPDAWQSQSQVVYSGVNAWDTAYHAYLTVNNIEEVKFPFCSITRNDTQSTFSKWKAPLTVTETPTEGVYEVPGALIKPVRCSFDWTIYRRDHLLMEDFIDIMIVSGSCTQEMKYFSEVLNQNSEFSFYFEEPQHSMVPDKGDRINGGGHIFSVTIPVVVDCVLGVPKSQKLIGEIIQTTILDPSGIIVSVDSIQDPDFPLNP